MSRVGVEDRSRDDLYGYVFVRSSVGLGLRIEDRSCGDFLHFYCKSLGGSRAKV